MPLQGACVAYVHSRSVIVSGVVLNFVETISQCLSNSIREFPVYVTSVLQLRWELSRGIRLPCVSRDSVSESFSSVLCALSHTCVCSGKNSSI